MTLKSKLVLGFLTAITCGNVIAQSLPDSQYFDSNGVSIHYVEQGAGEAVILMHGYTRSVNDWSQLEIFKSLAKDYRVIAFDARGHGKSDKPSEISAYGLEMSRDIIRLLDHLDIDRAHFIASSMGGRVFAPLMPTYPDRLLTVTFIGFAPVWNWSADIQQSIERRSDNMLSNPPQRLIDQGQDTQALGILVLGFSQLVVTKQKLRNVKVPTFAIAGSEDRNLTRLKELKTLMPNMQLLIIDGEGHGLSNLARHLEFVTSIRSFIADH